MRIGDRFMVPKLRFKKYTNEWKEIELKKISNEIAYGMNAAAKAYDGENKYIRITDIDEISNKYSDKDIVSPDGVLDNKFLVKENDILFARTGASTGKTYLYDKNDGKMYYAGFLIKASIINHDSNFIFQQTKTTKYNRWVKIMSMRSGQPGINSQEYGSYKFSITSLDEEKDISTFLSLLDKKIDLQNNKILSLQKLKKGILENIFKSDYPKVCLKDILKERKLYSEKGLDYPHVTLSKDGIYDKGDRYNRDFLVKSDEKQYKITKLNDLCYNPANLKFGVICLNEYGSAIFSPIYVTFEIDKEVNPKYIKYYTMRNNFINAVRKYEQGTVYERMAVSPEDFLRFDIKLPDRKTQDEIVNKIDLLDNKINLESKLLEELELLKKGLMQNMFV